MVTGGDQRAVCGWWAVHCVDRCGSFWCLRQRWCGSARSDGYGLATAGKVLDATYFCSVSGPVWPGRVFPWVCVFLVRCCDQFAELLVGSAWWTGLSGRVLRL